MKKSYGFIYDKQGNLKEVNPPVHARKNYEIHTGEDGNPRSGYVTHTTDCEAHVKTNTGAIIPTVGHPGF